MAAPVSGSPHMAAMKRGLTRGAKTKKATGRVCAAEPDGAGAVGAVGGLKTPQRVVARATSVETKMARMGFIEAASEDGRAPDRGKARTWLAERARAAAGACIVAPPRVWLRGGGRQRIRTLTPEITAHASDRGRAHGAPAG